MEITIDASSVLAVCINEPSKPQLISLTKGASLLAPKSIHWEVGNALSAMLKRDRIDLVTAEACLQAYKQIPIKLVDVDLCQSLALAVRFQIYAYDAYLLNCAIQYHAPILSLDDALNIAARELGITTLGEWT